ncbi:MAG: mechanosensitive ion channel [Herpetosiphonaceae bacterium]|nr:mechanosensitive ion channel [Herpetosiphonaceae bacterium]
MVNNLVRIFVGYLPNVLGALAILVFGLVLAVLVQRVVSVLLKRLQFDQLCTRTGVTAVLREGGIQRSPSAFVGRVLFYAVLIAASLTALGALGLPTLATNLSQVVGYIPHALLAMVILILGTSASGLLAALLERVLGEVGITRTAGLTTFLRIAIIFIAATLAAAVLGIDVTLLIAIIAIILGGVVVAGALALGLGLRPLSQNIAASRYVSEGIAEGDTISVEGFSGTVERIGYALTTLRHRDGQTYLIPNAYFMEHVVQKEAADID